ncbi:hypothetical protein KBY80_04705 [Synechococcus sp. JJ3a-Johnson]|uniref:hypothetical protein n=1 Tax=unclassified Synechococcus TaxID=2626047 RepID=UPI0020CCA33D|nr:MULTISPECIES: hypothetical protein [unclassified Synechococcus]MCP9830689.1 hypothetical protein [Synechococcus sp. JJ3a-Johnson]
MSLLLLVLLGLHHWLMEPLLRAATAVFELSWLPWLLLGLVAWVLAGGTQAKR